MEEMPGRVATILRLSFGTLLALSPRPGCEASPLHWITRLGHTNCDNHPVAKVHHRNLMPRPEASDLDTPLHFEAERPFASGSTLLLVVCNGEVHVLPDSDPDKLRVSVRLGARLGGEWTPRSYLQEFEVSSSTADIEWKLPERVHPVIDIYVPMKTSIDLQLGKTEVEVKGVRGNKVLNVGKGTARLYVENGDSEYSSIVVDVAMGSFADLRRPGKHSDHVPFHEEFSGKGSSTAHLQMAMGKAEIAPE
jgi:hypothetical protein